MNANVDNSISSDRSWEKIIMKYNRPDLRKSLWQIVNTFIPYVGMWFLMYFSLQYPYWVTLLLAFPAAGFTIRLFILFHDCGHGSFFKSQKVNDVVGKILGIIVLVPYTSWHYSHKLHHNSSGNLDKRGDGDVMTLTVDEYNSASGGKRLWYRMYRNPWFMFTIGAVYMIFSHRFTRRRMSRKDKNNVYFTNVMILSLAALLSLWIGLEAFLLILLPVVLIAFSSGIWLFYVQHQFDDVYWDHGQGWDYKSAAIQGSSFLQLPSILQWFSGSIGFHHIHHLSPRIPNYNLARCHFENDFFKDIRPITMFSSIATLKLRLWDDLSKKMISFRQMTESSKMASYENTPLRQTGTGN